MSLSSRSYSPQDPDARTVDARVKIIVLAAFSVAAFFVESWTGIAALLLLSGIALRKGSVRARMIAPALVPVAVFACMSVLFGALQFPATPTSVAPPIVCGFSSALPPARDALISFGAIGISLDGALRGAFLGARIVALALASFAVCFSTPSTALVSAFSSLLAPLRVLRVPVDDIAMVLSLAVRFIPYMVEEFQGIRRSHRARGARLGSGGVGARVKANAALFVPLFVRLFRHADAIALAMTARCYGAGVRTSLSRASLSAPSVAVLVCGLVLLTLIAWAL